jgi:hypothetical protein
MWRKVETGRMFDPVYIMMKKYTPVAYTRPTTGFSSSTCTNHY